jgi:hypothetical protein
MALSVSNNLLISNSGASEFIVREVNGVDNGETIPVFDENGSFTFSAGDMTSGCNTSSDENEGDCQAFNTYYANHGPGVTGTDLYGVTYVGSDAVLDFITNVNYEAHIAYDAENDIIYAVNANGSFLQGIDPDGANPPVQVNINGNINQLFAVVYNPADDLLYVGDANDDEIHTIDPVSGNTNLVATGPVQGGDLAIQDGELYLASRGPDMLYHITGGVANLVGSIPSEVNGMAQANNVTGLIVSRATTDEFVEVSAADGTVVQTYNAVLNNAPFTLSNGDMAAGCADAPDLDVCDGEIGSCHAQIVVEYVEGTTLGGGSIAANRTNPDNVLGEPEATDEIVFTSLGYGGSITVIFGGTLENPAIVPNGPGDDIYVTETSFNTPGCEAYEEYAIIEVSQDGVNFYEIGEVCKGEDKVDISDAKDENGNPVALDCVTHVRVSNENDLTTTPDGFDVDGFTAAYNCLGAIEIDETEPEWSVDVTESATLSSFPNPTAGLSQAVFVTSSNTRATLEVYDMNGRMVEGLFSGVAEGGVEYRMDFDGMDLPNGVYMYRLTTDNETIIEKFMIAR